MKQNHFWWIRHSKNTLHELSEAEAKRNKLLTLIIDLTVLGVVLLLLSTALFLQNGFAVIPAFFILMIRSIFWMRRAGTQLANYRRDYLKAVRSDGEFPVSRKWVLGQTLLASSVFYVFWFGTAFFLPLDGYYGWLFTSVASGFFSFVVFKAFTEYWHDLGLSRFAFWGLQFGAFILASLPGAITAYVLY